MNTHAYKNINLNAISMYCFRQFKNAVFAEQKAPSIDNLYHLAFLMVLILPLMES